VRRDQVERHAAALQVVGGETQRECGVGVLDALLHGVLAQQDRARDPRPADHGVRSGQAECTVDQLGSFGLATRRGPIRLERCGEAQGAVAVLVREQQAA
jgi:hypothetical protein